MGLFQKGKEDEKLNLYLAYKNQKMAFNEAGYLNEISNILKNGIEKADRTGVGTLSVFGIRMEFDLSTFPLLTTKSVPWKVVLKELLWFISGKTNTKLLEQQGVKIWMGNSSKEFLSQRGLDYPEGEIGPMYGYQWRHFNAPYPLNHNQGIDQLAECIKLIRQEPTSRRIICSAWNPEQQSQMALPPCHVLFQFYVRKDYLDLQLYQRSGDMMLGVPFNICSYAMLVYMVAHITNLKPGRLVHVIGDAHIYLNHIEGAKLQLSRDIRSPPTLKMKKRTSIDDFTVEDFELENYNPHPSIKLEMAI